MNVTIGGKAAARALTVIPTGIGLGAEVSGVDLRTIDDDDFAAIHRAWLDHLVLLFRDQRLGDDDLIAFSRRFGELDWAPVQETGRRFVDGHPELYVVRRRNAYIEGLPLEQSETLLDEIGRYASRAEITWYNRWRVGDLVLWDNRCTMHRRDPFDPGSRRIMHRTQIKGETRPAA